MTSRTGPRLLHAWFGVLATLVGLALGHLVAVLTEPAASPVLAVGAAVIDRTPTPQKEWAIRELGSNDKTVLVGSVLVVVLVLAGLAGLLARRRPAYGAAMLLFLVAVAALAALGRPTAGVTDLVPSLAAAVGGVGSLLGLERACRRLPRESSVAGAAPGPSRRGVLLASGALAAAAVALGGLGRWIGSYRTRPEDVALPAPADPAPAFPRGLEDRVPGITPLRTAAADFYRVDTRLDVPAVDLDGWSLTVDGDVDRELVLRFEDLLRMDLVERDITLTCVSNEVGGRYVGGARWRGVLLTDLLDRAGTSRTRADQILSTDVDGMTISTPLALATDGRDAMVAIGMNGAALPREHGFPARLVVPGLYGFISATKWITRMTLTTYAAQDAYWTQRGWATDAPVKIASRVDTPRPLSTIDPGRTVIGGVAWAQHRGGIARVEVRVDGGPWQRARLGPSAGNDYWRQWALPWTATSGQHTLSVRATDGRGEVQTAARATPFPDGASGIQQVLVTVR